MSELRMHLTEEQLDDVLIGDVSAEAAAHLKACPRCAARMAAATMPMTSFKAVSAAWSERATRWMPVRARVWLVCERSRKNGAGIGYFSVTAMRRS